jgi:hypothetical protein
LDQHFFFVPLCSSLFLLAMLRSKILAKRTPPTTTNSISGGNSGGSSSGGNSSGGASGETKTTVAFDAKYPVAVREIQNVFSDYTLDEILLLYRMKGNSVEATSNLLAIDGFNNKEEILNNAKKFQQEHGSSGATLADGKEGPRQLPRSASLAMVSVVGSVVGSRRCYSGGMVVEWWWNDV